MANLQQVNFQYLDSGQQDDEQLVTAIHRRSGILVTYRIGSGIFDFYECKQWNDLNWKRLGAWNAKSEFDKVLRVVAIESYDVFAILGTNQSGSSVAVLGFDGILRSCVKISNGADLVGGDFNQKTREFIVVFQSGVVLCLFMKVISKTEYHLTRRRNTRLGNNDSPVTVVQVMIQDLINNVLLLTKKGHIICLGIDRFDIVFTLSPDLFSIKPTKLIVDKFGTDFLVQCTNSETNKEQLEYWHPPTDYTTCRENLFGRITIPLPAQILGIAFESLGLFGAKTLISITTLNKKVQLWSASEENTLLFQADLKLNNPSHLWQSTQTLLNASRLSQDLVFPTLHLNCSVHIYLPMPKMNDLTYNTLYLTTVAKSTAFLGVHTIDQVENAMSLVMMDLEIKRMQERDLRSQQQYSLIAMKPMDLTMATKSTLDNGIEKSVPTATDLDLDQYSQDNLQLDRSRSKSRTETDGATRSSPLSTGRKSPLDYNIPINPFEGFDEGSFGTLQKMERDVKTTVFPAQNNSFHVHPDAETRFFFPSYYLSNKDVSRCSQQYNNSHLNVLNRLVYPNYIYTDKNDDMFSFNLCGLQGIDVSNPFLLPDVVPVKYFSFANRSQQVLVVSEVKDCLLYDLHVLNTPPLRIPISLRLQARITVAICCDVTLRSPAPLVQVASKSKAATSKVLVDIENIYTMIIFGDDQGFVHLFICDSATKVLQTDMFRAHTSAITHIIPTGDCCRPYWTIGSEYIDGNLNVIPLCIPGSAFVTVSREGEFKTWLPQGPETRGTSYDRFFLGNIMKWKLSGIFTCLQSTTVLNSYADTYELLTDNFKKVKSIETVVLAPSCMNLLVGYSNGLFEEWHIPGVIDSCDSVLATSQRPIWSTVLHSDGIVTCRVHAHSSLSVIKEVTFPSDKDRDKILAGLTSFVRVSNRVRRTVGISFSEAKLLTGSSSVVTCSNDRSLILWGLQPTFFQHCSFLHPIPCRKFYFSAVPIHGMAFCLNTQTSTPNSPHNVWRLDCILEGRIITVMSEFRGRMFQACDQHAIEDHRLALGNASYILSFDDDLLFEFSRPTTGSSKRRSLSSIPVIGKVSKASVLVGCHHMFSEAFRAKSTESKAKYPFLMSSGLLEEWAKLKDGKDEPVVHYTHEEKEEHVPLEIDWKEELDEHIPPRPFTPVNTAAEHSHKSPIAVVPPRPISPSILKMEIENIAKYPESDAFSPVKKFTHNGIYMQANAEKLEQTLAFLDKTQETKFILDKFNGGLPSIRPSTFGNEIEHAFSIRQYDFLTTTGDKSVISFTDDLTLSTAANLQQDSRELDGLTLATGTEEKDAHISPGKSPNLMPEILSLQKNKEKDDAQSVITDESSEKGKDMVHQTRTSQLRQQTVMKAKERMDLVDNYNGPAGFGDSRKSTKSYYTSKNTILNEDNKQFQGGTRQPLGTNTLFAPPANGAIVKAGIIVPTTQKEVIDKPTKKSSLQIVPGIPGFEGGDEYPLQEPTPTAEPGKLYYAREKADDKTSEPVKTSAASSQHSKPATGPQEEAKQKYVVNKPGKSRSVKPLAPRKHPAGRRGLKTDYAENSSEGQYNDDDESIQSSIVSLQSDEPGAPIPGKSPSHPSPGHVLNPAVPKQKIIKSDDSSSSHRLQHHPAIPPVPGPQSLFLDLPDQRLLKRRRHALQLVKNLADRGVSIEDTPFEKLAMAAMQHEAAKGMATDDASEESSIFTTGSEETQISTYFDRTAKPIFVDRKKPQKQQFPRKGTPKSPNTAKRTSSNDSDDESTTGKLDDTLQGMSDEDRLLFQGLDEAARKKLLEDMKNAKGSGKGQSKLMKQLTKKAFEDSKELALLNMDLTLETLELNDLNFTVSLGTVSGGAIYVVLLNSADAQQLSHQYFANDKTIATIPGYCEHRKFNMAPNSFEEISYDDLKPLTHYTVLAFVNLNSLTPIEVEAEKPQSKSKSKPSTAKVETPIDTSKITNWWNLDIETKEEQFDIEWHRLDLDMRLTEIRAAIRNEFVQAKAFYHFPSIIIPSDEEVQTSDFKALLSPDIDGKTLANLKKKVKPHFVIFLEWWAGQDKAKASTKVRSEYQSLECIHAILHHKQFLRAFEAEGYCSGQDSQLLVEYVKKNTYQKAKVHGSLPGSIANPVGESVTSGSRRKSAASGTSGDLESASAKSGVVAVSVASNSTAFHERGLNLMKVFRSWYKGGQVVRYKEEQRLQEQANAEIHRDDQSVSEASEDIHPGSLVQYRLEQRTEFLKELIENVVEATNQINKLWEGYKSAVGKSFRESDLIYERANLSPKDLNSICSAKKFLELCMDYSMFSPELESGLTAANHNPRTNRNETPQYRTIDLSALDAYQSLLKSNPNLSNAVKPSDFIDHNPQVSPTPSFVVLQRLSGADIFRAVDVELLKPDDPPPVNIKCLPGTNRRPIRPWQLMSLGDQELELAVACTLDMIWELAISDCVEVPAPEDRLLNKEQFPLRRRIWDEFREWYAGDEEVNQIPGQGTPTLARVVFAEECETKQVENDDGTMNLMREKNLALPRKFRDPGVTLSSAMGIISTIPVDTISVSDKSFNDSVVSSVRLPHGKSGGSLVGIPEDSSKSVQFSQSQSQSVRKTGSAEEMDTMSQAYERAINTSKGGFVRSALLSATLNAIVKSRRMNILKYFWPPAMNRMTWQFLFPRCGFIIPPYSMPLKRFHLYASRSRERYNVDEIMRWYTSKDLDNEDILMTKAEAKGVKLRAYHEWLAKEPERLAYSRLNMELEDSAAFQHRQIDHLIAERFANFEQKLIETDEFLEEYPNGRMNDRERGISFASTRRSMMGSFGTGENDTPRSSHLRGEADSPRSSRLVVDLGEGGEGHIEKAISAAISVFEKKSQRPSLYAASFSPDKNIAVAPPVMQFRFLENLPKEYWYIFEESIEFKYSSGIYNEDEVEEMKEMQQAAAKKAIEDALAFERSLHEEKKKRDMEEKMRMKREEQDRRLKEGVARRRMIRESLEEIKRQRLIKKEEEMLEAMRIMEEERLKAEEEEKERLHILELERIEAERLQEVELMAYEELYVRELLVRKRELVMMEHEDITSFLREQLEVQEEIEKDARVQEITRIYESFQPYQFKQSRIKRPVLHSVLRDKHEIPEKDAFLESVRTSLHQHPMTGEDGHGHPVRSSGSASSTSFGSEHYFHFLALQEHETESASRHRSKRYDMIYGDAKPSAELDSILASRGMTSHLHTSAHHSQTHSQASSQMPSQVHSPRGVSRSRTHSAAAFENGGLGGGELLGTTTISSPKKGNKLLYRELGHSPTKKQVRDLVNSMIEEETALPFNPYSTEWEIGDPYKHITPVLLNNVPMTTSPSVIPLFSRPSTRGGLTASGPISPTGRCSPPVRSSGYGASGTNSPKKLKASGDEEDRADRERGGRERLNTAGNYNYEGEYELDDEGNVWYHETSSNPPHHPTTSSSVEFPIQISLESISHAPSTAKAMADEDILQDTLSSSPTIGGILRIPTHSRHHQPGRTLDEIQEGSIASDLFQSQESSMVYDEEKERESARKDKKTGGRKKLKELLALSADVIAKSSSQQEWLDFLATQKKLTMASLVSLDARSHAREMNPILASLKAQQRAAIINATNTVMPQTQNQNQNHTSSSSGPLQIGMPTTSTSIDINLPTTTAPTTTADKPLPPKKKLLLKKEDIMSQSAPVEFSLIDSKTKKLGKSASETVIKLQQQRAAIRQYVSGNAILGDNFFMEACQPGIRNVTSLEGNEEVRRFAQQLQEHLEKEPHDSHHHNMAIADQQQVLPPLELATPKSARGHHKDKKTIATSLTSLTSSDGFLPMTTTLSAASKISPPLQTRVIPSKSSVSALVTGSTMKIEKDIKRKRLKPIGPQKSASTSALPLSALAILNDPLVSSALNGEGLRPGSSDRPMRSIEFAIRTPDKTRDTSREDPGEGGRFHSSLSLESKPALPPING